MTGTISPTLPTIGQPNSTQDPDVRESLITLRDALNAVLTSGNKIDPSLFENESIKEAQLAKAVRPNLKLYTPVNIPGEGSTESASYTTIETESKKDRVQSVEISENGLILVMYKASFKNSGGSKGRAAIHIGSNQLKTLAGTAEGPEQQLVISSASGSFRPLLTCAAGLILPKNFAVSADVATGMSLGTIASGSETGTLIGEGGFCFIYGLAASSYEVSIRYLAESNKTSVKERRLWVATLN